MRAVAAARSIFEFRVHREYIIYQKAHYFRALLNEVIMSQKCLHAIASRCEHVPRVPHNNTRDSLDGMQF